MNNCDAPGPIIVKPIRVKKRCDAPVSAIVRLIGCNIKWVVLPALVFPDVYFTRPHDPRWDVVLRRSTNSPEGSKPSGGYPSPHRTGVSVNSLQ